MFFATLLKTTTENVYFYFYIPKLSKQKVATSKIFFLKMLLRIVFDQKA